MKISKKRELQQSAVDHSSDSDSKDFMELLYRNFTVETCSFLVIDTKTLPSNNPLRFRKNLLEKL